MNRKKRNLLAGICILAVLALASGLWIREKGNSVPEDRYSEQAGESEEKPENRQYTEEQKAYMEGQTGVTIRDDGTTEVNIGKILEEEKSAAISREEAEEKILKEAGEGYEMESLGLKKYKDKIYWAARVIKGGEARQIWIDAETGETLLNQKE